MSSQDAAKAGAPEPQTHRFYARRRQQMEIAGTAGGLASLAGIAYTVIRRRRAEARGSFYRNAHVEESVGHALLALEAVTISAVISVGGFVAGVAAVSTGLNVYTFGEFSAWARHTCRTRFPWLRVPIDEEKLAREQAIVDEIWQRSDAEGAERAEARERRRAERARSQSARRQVWEDWKQRQLDRWGLGGLSDLTDRLEESKAESTGPPGQEREPEGGPGGHEKAR